MSSTGRRPVVGSRNPTARPRVVAGRRDERASGPGSDLTTDLTTDLLVEDPPEQESAAGTPDPTPRHRLLPLVAVVVVLLVVAAAEAWYLWGKGDPVVSADRPVVVSTTSARAAVDVAAKAAETIVSTSWKDYGDQVDDAVATMTPRFAEEYRKTAEEVRPDVVSTKTEVQAEVSAQAVVSASHEQVKALLYLNQYVTKKGAGTSYTPYRALVTVERTDHGWLVDDLQTR